MYWERDADLLEPMLPRLDRLLERVCGALACPPHSLHLAFENTADSLAQLANGSHGFEPPFSVRFPSPHLMGFPADECSCDELYRAVGTRLVLALVDEASDSLFDLSPATGQAVLQCELARAGLGASLPTEETSPTLRAALWADWSPLRAIPLFPSVAEPDTRPSQFLLPYALAFIEEQVGPGSVARLIPKLTSDTLGQAIEAGLDIEPATLEAAWLKYTLKAKGQVHEVDARAFDFAWSPNGDKLAYAFVQDLSQPTVQVEVIDAASGQIETTLDKLTSASLAWRADGSLCVRESDKIHLLTGATSTTIEIEGTDPLWSPDGAHLAYTTGGADQLSTLWIADARGQHAQPMAQGREPVWSPDGKRVAFWKGTCMGLKCGSGQPMAAAELVVLDTTRTTTVTLARSADLLQSTYDQLYAPRRSSVPGDIAWSPDGRLLAVTIAPDAGSPVLFVLNADDGLIRARVTADAATSHIGWDRLALSLRQAWSPDSRYVSFGALSSSTGQSDSAVMGLLDVQTGRSISLPCAGKWDWLAEGQWLAVPQRPSGVLLTTPDLSEMQWLDTPASFSVAWRPGS